MTGPLKVNFSEQEAASEGRTFEPLPTGEYMCYITEIDLAESKSEKNYGKPYWRVTCTVADGPYVDRKIFTNVMLFEGALYSIVQMIKAAGFDDAIKTGVIPEADKFIGKKMIVIAKKQLDTYAMERDGGDEKQYKNEVKGFKPADGASTVKTPSGTKQKNSLLP